MAETQPTGISSGTGSDLTLEPARWERSNFKPKLEASLLGPHMGHNKPQHNPPADLFTPCRVNWFKRFSQEKERKSLHGAFKIKQRVRAASPSLLCPAVTAVALVLSALIAASHPQRSQHVSVSAPHGGAIVASLPSGYKAILMSNIGQWTGTYARERTLTHWSPTQRSVSTWRAATGKKGGGGGGATGRRCGHEASRCDSPSKFTASALVAVGLDPSHCAVTFPQSAL